MADEVDVFEQERQRLQGLAYRMLGTHADANDVVQETWLRWRAADRSSICEPGAWLTTVCSRLAIDALNSAKQRREQYPGVWLPEPLVEDDDVDPAARAELDESVSVAMMLALERLSAAERAVLLLHDVFGHDFAAVASITGRTEVSCRQLAVRAREKVRSGRPRFVASAAEHRRLLTAFLDAARVGATDDLTRMLAADAELHGDAGGRATTAPHVLSGPEAIARFLCGVWRSLQQAGTAIEVVPHWFNGRPALLVREAGRLTTAISIEVVDGRIRRVFSHRNPDKLAVFAHRG